MENLYDKIFTSTLPFAVRYGDYDFVPQISKQLSASSLRPGDIIIVKQPIPRDFSLFRDIWFRIFHHSALVVGEDQILDLSYPESRILSAKQFLKHSYDYVLVRLRTPLPPKVRAQLKKYAAQRTGENYGLQHFGYAVSQYTNAHYLEKHPTLFERQFSEYLVRNNVALHSPFQNCSASVLQPLIELVPQVKRAFNENIESMDQERVGVIAPQNLITLALDKPEVFQLVHPPSLNDVRQFYKQQIDKLPPTQQAHSCSSVKRKRLVFKHVRLLVVAQGIISKLTHNALVPRYVRAKFRTSLVSLGKIIGLISNLEVSRENRKQTVEQIMGELAVLFKELSLMETLVANDVLQMRAIKFALLQLKGAQPHL